MVLELYTYDVIIMTSPKIYLVMFIIPSSVRELLNSLIELHRFLIPFNKLYLSRYRIYLSIMKIRVYKFYVVAPHLNSNYQKDFYALYQRTTLLMLLFKNMINSLKYLINQ